MSAQPKFKPGYGPGWHRMLVETGWWHSFELPDGRVIRGVSEIPALRERLGQFPIPQDLTGRRALDIGCWDGWFSFELERRGAEVVAIDIWDNPRFREMHAVYGSRVDYRQMDVYELSPETVGTFDIVLFFGVLYHLKHPLLALEKVCSVTTGLAAVDSFVLRENFDLNAQPLLHFYENDEFEGQTDNWVAPNLACLAAMCRTAGFARVDLCKILTYSAGFACHRQFQAPRAEGARAEILQTFHNTNYGVNCSWMRDDYLACAFRTEEANLTRGDVQPRVGGYGVRPISVTKLGSDFWQTNFKVPPGLAPGWHPVTIAVREGPESAALRIAVDLPLPDNCELKIVGIRDGATWAAGQLDLKAGRILCIWCEGFPDNADANNVRVFLNGSKCSTVFVGPVSSSWQVNVEVPRAIAPGEAELTLKLGRAASASGKVRLLAES
ncbi:MAG TPA: methyltransferase domain-containing protein [Bryobacteraceae bacterium]|nr:methyltransferase domain-containing protein [Bryobacteraceae bacterium]